MSNEVIKMSYKVLASKLFQKSVGRSMKWNKQARNTHDI